MLQLSKATDYALLFLTNLARQPDRQWNVREASESLNISRRFLANIVHQLARNEIVKTTKGAGGGVTLRKETRGITLWDIVQIFEGPLNLVSCAERSHVCDHVQDCDAHIYWSDLKEQMVNSLSRTTLYDLGGHS
ncbi:MAG TPA: Rrf2 family transcriptional regulator [Thermoanaerobaculia bacterium]|nr:Rrf2 family transcriptional regulator [Thermoanaerobaculia bacterium]HUM28823.1 Rrf2 family transcriptional regulator [Thermoanaerobaculia bacterium]HXK69080.1 Rrf2 family transcriptional regulator [Thermoanaerobaculia bacterium]